MSLIDRPRLAVRANSGAPSEVESLEAAAAAWSRVRDKTGVPSSQAPRITVVDLDSGKVVARIAYNGTIIRQ
jgi:hypothetical protein